jgi:hypothetical protein
MKFKQTFILTAPPHPARRNLARALEGSPDGYAVTISEPSRTLEQNSAMWPILACWAKQKEWPVNGVMTKLTPEEWKIILTSAYKREALRIAQGLDGGMVLLGARTRDFGKKEFSDWLEFLHAASNEHGIDTRHPDDQAQPSTRGTAA